MEKGSDSIFGFFASFSMNDPNEELIKSLLWGPEGLSQKLEPIKHTDYGTDFKLILFQVYSNPISYRLDSLKPLENYRRKEKAIGIPIVLDDDNFFNIDDQQRRNFLRMSLLNKLHLLGERVKKGKMDLKVPTLINDVTVKLRSW